MVKQGDEIFNARTGQKMIFLKTAHETNGELLQIECFSPPSDAREPEHLHPYQENNFKIITGSCVFSIEGKQQTAGAGETISIPPGVRHHFWNSGVTDCHYIQEFKPALTIDGFFDTFFALSRDGKLDEKGIPNFFHASVIALAHRNDIRLTSPPWAIQYLTYLMLAPIGRVLGYRPEYTSKQQILNS